MMVTPIDSKRELDLTHVGNPRREGVSEEAYVDGFKLTRLR